MDRVLGSLRRTYRSKSDLAFARDENGVYIKEDNVERVLLFPASMEPLRAEATRHISSKDSAGHSKPSSKNIHEGSKYIVLRLRAARRALSYSLHGVFYDRPLRQIVA